MTDRFNKDALTLFDSLSLQVKFLNGSNLSEVSSISMTNTVLDVSTFNEQHVVMASTSIQLVDLQSQDRRRTIADDVADDENLEDPPLHLAQFGPTGKVVTASVESNVLKLWPSMSSTSSPHVQPEARIQVQDDSNSTGCIYRYTYVCTLVSLGVCVCVCVCVVILLKDKRYVCVCGDFVDR